MTETQPRILIATPAYNGQINAEYLHAVLTFQAAGIRFSVQTISNESLITRARNRLISNFWHMPEFSHLLFLDADVFLDIKGLQNMLHHNKDVIGAPVALKSKSESGEPIWNTDAKIGTEPGLQIANRIGTAVFMLNRTAVGALVEDAIQNNCTYATLKNKDQPDAGTEEHYDIFQLGIVNNEYLSEDFWVCQRLRQLGFDIHVDTSVYTRHTGMVVFDQSV